jgi:hypothetical protein
MLDLDAIEARAEAATPGPWRNEPDTGAGRVWVQRGYFRDEADCEPLFSLRGKEAYEQRSADADFIARARTDIPALVAELRAAREVVEAAQANANTWDEYYHQRPVDRNLVSALAAYRAVVGTSR